MAWAFVLAFSASGLAAQEPGTALPTAWLAGCWRQAVAGEIVEEVWLPPAGGMMLGMSRTVQDDTVRTYEQMVIRQGENGLLFEATPSGQLPAAFLATLVSDTAVVFENLTREFPRRIRYARVAGDSTVAVVSGEVRDRLRTIEYHYARVPCPGTPPPPE